MFLRFILIASLVLSGVSCSMFRGKKDGKLPTQEELNKSIPQNLLPKKYRQKPNASLSGRGGGGSSGSLESAVSFTRPDDIVWSDPDDPYNEKGTSDLEQVLAKKSKGPWETSFTEATKRAKQEGKPLLIWFTSTKNSPVCNTLSRELFGTAKFESWTKQHLIKLRVNTFVEDPLSKLGERQEAWLDKLKTRFSVKGTPTTVVLTPNEKVIARYRGYKTGNNDFFLGQLKQANLLAERDYADWRAKLESKGYRDWTGSKGRKIFAKLARYKEGNLILIDPGGKRMRTTEGKLSTADRKWIAEEKAKRAN